MKARIEISCTDVEINDYDNTIERIKNGEWVSIKISKGLLLKKCGFADRINNFLFYENNNTKILYANVYAIVKKKFYLGNPTSYETIFKNKNSRYSKRVRDTIIKFNDMKLSLYYLYKEYLPYTAPIIYSYIPDDFEFNETMIIFDIRYPNPHSIDPTAFLRDNGEPIKDLSEMVENGRIKIN